MDQKDTKNAVKELATSFRQQAGFSMILPKALYDHMQREGFDMTNLDYSRPIPVWKRNGQ